MDLVQSLTHYNWFVVVLAVISAMMVFKFISELFTWFIEKFGLETRSMREKRENKELLKKTAENLNSLQERHTKDEKDFRAVLNKHISESEKDRKALHQVQVDLVKSQSKISDSMQGLKDSIKTISDSNAEKDKQITSLIQAQKEMLAEKINEKYKYYLSIGGVPEDERDEFVSLHDAYKGVGGNHNGDAKFEYCINHLPIIPVETKLIFNNEN